MSISFFPSLLQLFSTNLKTQKKKHDYCWPPPSNSLAWMIYSRIAWHAVQGLNGRHLHGRLVWTKRWAAQSELREFAQQERANCFPPVCRYLLSVKWVAVSPWPPYQCHSLGPAPPSPWRRRTSSTPHQRVQKPTSNPRVRDGPKSTVFHRCTKEIPPAGGHTEILAFDLFFLITDVTPCKHTIILSE